VYFHIVQSTFLLFPLFHSFLSSSIFLVRWAHFKMYATVFHNKPHTFFFHCGFHILKQKYILSHYNYIIYIYFFDYFVSCSIYAQKLVDENTGPRQTGYNFRQYHEPRILDRPMHGAIHADLKHSPKGTPSTFNAAMEYVKESNARRDELLAKYHPPSSQ
jgi:hypothetical protein